jgi:hypothetical protein
MANNVKAITILNQMSPSYSTSGAIVAAGGVSTIAAGTPTKLTDAASSSPWTGAVVPMVDADGTTAQRFAGIAKSTSTDTASTAGSVDLYLPYPGLLYAAKAKTSTTFDTQAEVDANFGKGVFFDLTAGVWTVDFAGSASQVNCVMIVGGDFNTQTVYFNYKAGGTFLNSSISA